MRIKNLFFTLLSCFVTNKQRRRAYKYAFCGGYENSCFFGGGGLLPVLRINSSYTTMRLFRLLLVI